MSAKKVSVPQVHNVPSDFKAKREFLAPLTAITPVKGLLDVSVTLYHLTASVLLRVPDKPVPVFSPWCVITQTSPPQVVMTSVFDVTNNILTSVGLTPEGKPFVCPLIVSF